MTQSVLLIHPPLVKPTEPPAGLANLIGCLRRYDVSCTAVDANLEGLLYLMRSRVVGFTTDTTDAWTSRACGRLEENLSYVRCSNGYKSLDRYRKAVMDINRVLDRSVSPAAFRLSLADYHECRRFPVRSHDLIRAAENPSENPFYPYFERRFTALLERQTPAWIGFSLNYLSQALCCFAMIGFMRQIFPAAKIVVGGGLATTWRQRPDWRNPFQGLVDAWIAGAGEAPLLALLGIAPESGSTTPTYDIFPLEDYLSPSFILPYSASRGCYWRRCAFCPEKAEAGVYRPVPDWHVINELKQVIALPTMDGSWQMAPAMARKVVPAPLTSMSSESHRPVRPVLIHLLDNAVRPSLMHRMTLDSPGIPWYGFARISADLADPDFCLRLKTSGCVMLQLGIESGSQRVLDELDKGIDLAMAATALKALHQAGITTYIYLLFGTPPEREQEAYLTLDFVARNHQWIDFLNVAIFNLPAFSTEADTLETNEFYEADLSLYRSFRHPYEWNRKKVRHFLDRVFRRHAAVAEILKRHAPFFTSNHAPFFRRY